MDEDAFGPVTRRTPLMAASYVEAMRRRGQRSMPDVSGATSSVPTAREAARDPETDEFVRQIPGELVITLGLGQHVVTEDLILPDTTTLVPINGRVVTTDGQPVPDVDVLLVLGPDEDHESNPLAREFVSTSADGRFQLQGVLGTRYWVAVGPSQGAADVRQVSRGQTFLTTRDLPPVTVTVTVIVDPR